MTRLIVGCGYLGTRLLPEWKSDRLFVTTRRREGAEAFRNLGVEPVVCDVLTPETLRALPTLDTVLFAVGFDRGSGQSMRTVYVEGLKRVLDALPRPGKLIYVSSSSVYGQTDGGWVDESAGTEPREESGRIVLEAETLLRSKIPEAIILRFSGIYGPGRWLRRQTIERGEPIVGDADKWLNLIHVEDGARAIQAAEKLGQPGATYNVCDEEPTRRRDFYEEMARVLGAPTPRFVPVSANQATPPHELANRRIRNTKLKEQLAMTFEYPNFRVGLRQAAAPPTPER